MINWIKKKVVKYAIGVVKDKIALYEQKEPKLAEFHKNIYEMPVTAFVGWAVDTLSKEDLDKLTYVDLVKKLIIPLDDKVENIIDQALDDLKPGK